MASATNRLTPLTVKNASKPGYLSDGLNLFLQVAKGGSKSWIFKYEFKGQRREIGLGPCHTISLSEARLRASDLRRQLIDGIDPFTARKAAALANALEKAKAITFDQCAEQLIAAKRPGWKNEKHADQWISTLGTYASPVIGKLAVADIDTGLVLKVLEPIWASKQETASRLRGRIESVIDWATARKYRVGENPARWKGHLENLLANIDKADRIKHHAALPYAQISAFLKALRLQPGTASKAVELAILTACRSGEVRGASWQEIDLDGALWTIPASRMKAKKEHVVPLSAPALDLLRRQKAESANDLIFPGVRGGQLSDMSLTAVIRRMNGDVPIWMDANGQTVTVHGFRSSFRDWAGEVSNFPREVIEHALAHQLKDKAEAAYQRGSLLEKRRLLMAGWANFCDRPATATASVTPIRATA